MMFSSRSLWSPSGFPFPGLLQSRLSRVWAVGMSPCVCYHYSRASKDKTVGTITLYRCRCKCGGRVTYSWCHEGNHLNSFFFFLRERETKISFAIMGLFFFFYCKYNIKEKSWSHKVTYLPTILEKPFPYLLVVKAHFHHPAKTCLDSSITDTVISPLSVGNTFHDPQWMP